MGKNIERVAARLSHYINENNLADTYQSAYRQHHGTETALICVNNDILTALDNGKLTALILLDLSAAFDTVDHSVLLSRLQYYLGIHDCAYNWFQSYISNRPQKVCIGKEVSNVITLSYGVPQGSVLGPQLFTFYTLPIRDIILKYNLSYHVYADDTQLYISFNSTQNCAANCLKSLETCIQDISDWMKNNILKMNEEKTEFIIFGSPQQLQKITIPFIKIGNNEIPPVSQVRNLGVIFDSSMSFKPHISSIVRSSSFHLRNISRLRNYLNYSATEQLLHAMVTSRLDNGNALLYGLPKKTLAPLQKIQNTAARILTFSRKSCHITPLLKDLHWLPVSHRIIFKLMLIVYKSLNNCSPTYISDLISKYSPSRNLRSGNLSLLIECKVNRGWGERSFAFAAPHTWNSLPLDIRQASTLNIFKKKLKSFLMNSAFNNS